MTAAFGLLTATMMLAACGSDISLQEYAGIVEASRSCSEGDTCVLAGSGQCTCATPVNASRWESVEDAAADVECNGAQVECPTHERVRCEANRCRSDTL